MAVFIINNKRYDTEKMKPIAKVRKSYRVRNALLESIYGSPLTVERECVLYRSVKGNHLLVHEEDFHDLIGEAITEEQAKELMMKHDYKAYEALYGDIEEA